MQKRHARSQSNLWRCRSHVIFGTVRTARPLQWRVSAPVGLVCRFLGATQPSSEWRCTVSGVLYHFYVGCHMKTRNRLLLCERGRSGGEHTVRNNICLGANLHMLVKPDRQANHSGERGPSLRLPSRYRHGLWKAGWTNTTDPVKIGCRQVVSFAMRHRRGTYSSNKVPQFNWKGISYLTVVSRRVEWPWEHPTACPIQ